MRFRGMDRNSNGVNRAHGVEWKRTVVHGARLEQRRFVLSREEVPNGRALERGRMIAAEDDFNPNGPGHLDHSQLLQVLDRNQDSRITPAEWYYAPEYFRRADRDRNGSLNAAEFTGGSRYGRHDVGR